MKRAMPAGVSLSLYLRQLPRVLCHLRLITNRKSARYTLSRSLATLLLVFTSTGFAIAQANVNKIEQLANDRFDASPHVLDWVTGNVNEQKSHYAECMSIPYHLELIDLSPNTTYCVTIGYDTKKDTKNAIDFLTSYYSDVANAHFTYFGHTHNTGNEAINPLAETGLNGVAGVTFSTAPIPVPSFPGASGYTINPQTYFQGLAATDKLFHLYNGTFVGDPCFTQEQSLTGTGTVISTIRICFRLNAGAPTNKVVLAWGGHIASSEVWGPSTSATSINGSPYHSYVYACDETGTIGSCPAATGSLGSIGGCGQKEVQLQASAVVGGTCAITGPTPICANNTTPTAYTFTVSYTTSFSANKYQWTLINTNGSGASFSNSSSVLSNDSGNSKSVTVYLTGAGSFTLNVVAIQGQNPVSGGACSETFIYGTPTVSVPTGVTITCPSSTSVSISATANGATDPNYVWQRSADGGSTWVDITSGTMDLAIYSLTYSGINTSSLGISTTIGDANGFRYRIIVTNGNGCVATSNIAQLNILTCPLPIELKDFTGTQVEKNIILKWETETEKDNAYMEVQRSKDGIQFYPIGQVKGHGTTATPQSYLFVDQQPMPGINYYRLKQVDLDGKYEYHKVIAVPFESKKAQEIKIYPSPVKNILTIEWSEKVNGEHILSITDLLGRTILRKALAAETRQENLDVQTLAPGYYFITIQTGNKVSAIKFVKE